jgi:hypothetical protein
MFVSREELIESMAWVFREDLTECNGIIRNTAAITLPGYADSILLYFRR